MFLAEKTIKNYVSALFAKLGMERRTQAAAYAARIFDDHEQDEPDRPAEQLPLLRPVPGGAHPAAAGVR